MSINEKNLKVELNDNELNGVAGGDNRPKGFTQETAIFTSIENNNKSGGFKPSAVQANSMKFNGNFDGPILE